MALNGKPKKVFRFNPACAGFSSFAPRHSLQATSALGLSSVPFSTPSVNRKTKVFRFPLSVFRFLLTLPHKPKNRKWYRLLM